MSIVAAIHPPHRGVGRCIRDASDAVARLLRSVRFNIALGAVIASAAAIGTLLPQAPEAPEKAAAYAAAHPSWSRLFDFLGFFDIYHTWWFMGLLGLLAVDVVLCKLRSRPPDVGMVELPPEMTDEREAERHIAQKEAALRLKPFSASFSAPLPREQAAERAGAALAGAGYHVRREFSAASGTAFVATRHRPQRWGSYVAHIALVVILSGALVKGVFGFVEMVPVIEGGSKALQNKPDWEVYVDDFDVQYYDGTLTPKRFSSELRVQQGGTLLGAKTILVNDPLKIPQKFAPVNFYQASWGAGGMFRSATLRVGDKDLVLRQRVRTKVRGSPFEVEADVLLPNFTVTDGRADTAGLDLKNPAVRFVFHMGPHRTRPLWLFQNRPGLCLVEDDDGALAHAPKPPFELAAIEPILFSGIQVAYDPGYPLVLLGSVLWLLGTLSIFYLHRRRLWVLVEPDGAAAARVSVGGWSSRRAREFEREFRGLLERLRRALEAGAAFDFTVNPAVEVS